ncbi:MAG: nitrilase family protein [Flavobacteriales bacterium]|nr:nitrilase family protein [Flavobacteriales bacterium]
MGSNSSKSQLHILGLQSNLAWENPESNRVNFEQKIRSRLLEFPETDLIVLPEVFTTGFTMNLSKIDSWESRETLNWMTLLSSELNIALTGSIAFRFEDGTARNRSLFVRPDGSFEFYDKKHLFSFGSEDAFFEKGQVKRIVEFRGWKILLQICYDLRFPCFSRNTLTDRYDIALYVANWPEARIQPWRTLLQARAIENQCYVMGVNRTGSDANGILYPGKSLAVDVYGGICDQATQDDVVQIVCDRPSLEEFKTKFPVLEDVD